MRGALLAALVALGCGPGARPAARPEVPGAVIDEAAGVQLMLLPRPMQGQLWLALFIDAGARDATPVHVAAVAAWSACGPEISARVLPDATELALPCTNDTLPACLDSLAAALGTRSVGARALTAAMTRLRSERARALATSGRAADALALEALLGTSVDPFGDGGHVERGAVEDFLADHYGAGRALLIVIGDIGPSTLRDAVATAFDALRSPRRVRAERPDPTGGIRVEVGDADATSVATLFATPRAAAHVARRWVARVDSATASADVFPLRGGTALIVRGSGPLGPLVDRLRELREEPFDGAAVRTPDDPRGLASWHGARWASAGATQVGGLGVGAVVDGGRGDDIDAEDPDAALRTRAAAELEAELGWDPGIDGRIDDARADVRLENGARLIARRIPHTGRVAVAALFEGGAVEETRRQHGLTALLTAMSLEACAERATRELGVHPDTIGLRLTAIVGPDRTGLLFSGPRERWPELVYLAGRCARTSRIEAAHVDIARARLRRPEPRFAALAELVSPEAPGRISRLSSRLPGADTAEVRRWRDRVAVGQRAHYALVGDLPIARAVSRLARIVGRYPAGRAPEPASWGGPPEGPLAFSLGDTLGAWVVWSTPAEPRVGLAVAHFAEHAARTLARHPGLLPLERRSGLAGGRAWVAVLVGLDEETLARLPRLVAIDGDWSRMATDAVARERRARAWAAASPERSAVALASGHEALEESGVRDLFERLAASPARLVVARPAR